MANTVFDYPQFVFDKTGYDECPLAYTRAAMGLFSEIQEYNKLNSTSLKESVVSELGDILFWVTALEFYFPRSKQVYVSPYFKSFAPITSLLDSIEKYTRHPRLRNPSKKLEDLNNIVRYIALLKQGLLSEINKNNLNLDIVREYNIKKLTRRHG